MSSRSEAMAGHQPTHVPAALSGHPPGPFGPCGRPLRRHIIVPHSALQTAS